jgi:hypothetical protein
LTRLVCGYDGNVAFQLPMAIPFKPMPRLAAERWQRVRCVASNPSHPENYLAGALLDLLEGLHDKATPAPANDVPAPPKVTPEDVELQVGQTWLTRSGSTVKLVELDYSDDIFPFNGDNGYWYTKMGRITRTSKMNLLDLVELVSDVEQAPKPDVELQVGQTWLTRNGNTVKLVELDPDDDDFPFKGDKGYWYTKMGRTFLVGDTRGADLVELVSDVEQAPKPDAAPSKSLVERVALARMNPPLDEDDLKYARAAIHEVAAWARNDIGDFQFADVLEEEIDK